MSRSGRLGLNRCTWIKNNNLYENCCNYYIWWIYIMIQPRFHGKNRGSNMFQHLSTLVFPINGDGSIGTSTRRSLVSWGDSFGAFEVVCWGGRCQDQWGMKMRAGWVGLPKNMDAGMLIKDGQTFYSDTTFEHVGMLSNDGWQKMVILCWTCPNYATTWWWWLWWWWDGSLGHKLFWLFHLS